MKTTSFFSIGILLCSGLAFAGATPAQGNAQRLGFDDLKTACQNPAAYHNQVAPSNIEVSCVDVQTKWISDTPSSAKAANLRYVTASVTSDKYSVDAVTTALALPDQAMPCARYKEVSERLEAIHAVTCAEIIAFTGESSDFCAAAADTLRTANPAAVVRTDTGRSYDFCGQNEPVSPAQSPQAGN